MLAYLFSSALALSCFTADKKPVTGCEAYLSDDRSYASCLLQQRGYSGDVESTCADLGEIEAGCRTEWVRRHIPTGKKTAELNKACAGKSECLLLLSSLQPSSDVVEQARACIGLPDKVRDDCLHHLLLPWINGTPTTAELSALQSSSLPPFIFGPYLALAVECLKMTECPTEGELAAECAKMLLDYQAKPEICRSLGKGGTPTPLFE